MVLRHPGGYSCDCALQLGSRKEVKVVLSEWVLLLEQFLARYLMPCRAWCLWVRTSDSEELVVSRLPIFHESLV